MLLELHLLRPLWLLAFLPLLWILWYWSRHHTTNNVWHEVIDPHLLPHLLVGEAAPTTKLTMFLIGIGGTLGILALAGPAWERLPQPVYQVQAQRVIALDLSPTMNAKDVSPSRLAQARFKILDLLHRTKEGQTAMLAYGTEPFIVSPMTTDADTIAAQIPNLETDLLPTQGPRRPDLALVLAEKLLQQVASPNGQVLLVTDGMDYAATTQEKARQLREQGYKLSILGIGTEPGAPAPLADGGFLKDANGAIVISRLPSQELAKLAAISGGKYVTAQLGDQDLETLLMPMPTQNFQSSTTDTNNTNTDQWREEGSWLLLLLLPLAASAFRRGWLSPLLIGVIFFIPHPASAFDWQDLWLSPDQQGAKLLATGNAKEAAQTFQSQDWRAAAQYKAGDYAQALETLNQLPSEDTAYNKGNVLAQLGKFQDALNEYEKFLSKHPNDADAIANRDLMKRLLEQQKQQQQNQQESSSTEQQKQQDSSKEQQSASKNQDSKPSKDQQSESNEQSTPQDKNSQTEETKQEQAKEQSSAPNAKDLAQQQETTSQANKEQASKEQESKAEKSKEMTEMTAEKNSEQNLEEKEANQAMTYMLNRVPDDPGGLLRQRFLLQHLRNRDFQ